MLCYSYTVIQYTWLYVAQFSQYFVHLTCYTECLACPRHTPHNGTINFSKQIENQKLEFKAQSKVGSLDNVKHKPKGGDVKIFDDKEYIKQMSGQSPAPISRTESRQEVSFDTRSLKANLLLWLFIFVLLR